MCISFSVAKCENSALAIGVCQGVGVGSVIYRHAWYLNQKETGEQCSQQAFWADKAPLLEKIRAATATVDDALEEISQWMEALPGRFPGHPLVLLNNDGNLDYLDQLLRTRGIRKRSLRSLVSRSADLEVCDPCGMAKAKGILLPQVETAAAAQLENAIRRRARGEVMGDYSEVLKMYTSTKYWPENDAERIVRMYFEVCNQATLPLAM